MMPIATTATATACRVVTDREGRIWVSLNGFGLYVYNPATSQLRHIAKGDGSGLIDTDNLVYMMLDRDDNVWLACEHYGLVCLKTAAQGYDVVRPFPGSGGGASAEVRMMSRLSDGRIIVANNAGAVMQADSLLQHIVSLPTDGENYISACLDRQGRLWLGSRINGVNVGGRHYGEGRTDCILSGRDGQMWTCGLERHVSIMTLGSDGQFSEQQLLADVPKLNPRMLIENHRGDIWVASEQGLYVIAPTPPYAATKVSDEPARCVFEDSRRCLWVGTLTRGVLRADNADGRPETFSRMTRTSALAGDAVQMIAEDGHHNICIATQTGCSVIESGTQRIRNLYISDQQLRNFYEENSVARLADGRLALGTLDGIVVLDDAMPEKNAAAAHTAQLTNIFINGVSIFENDDLSLQDGRLRLSHQQNSLTFQTSNFDYANVGQTDYAFWLEGYDTGWNEPQRHNQTSYKNLAPGRYTLHVRARETGGNWGEESTLAVDVRPPLWATWWAYLLYLLLAVVIAYTLYRHLRYLFRLRQSVAVEKQLTEYKLKFFTNISHEFRTPLTLIQGSMDKLRQLPDAPASARQPLSAMQRNVDRLLRLINQLLEFRRMQNNKLQLALEETDIVSFVYNITQTFHDTADQQRIALSFVPAMKSLNIYADRGFVDKAVYNLLSNAFKYTPAGGSVTVRVRTVCEQVAVSVEDTGIGVPEEMRQKIFDRFQRGQIGRDSLGIGLDLTAELIRTHHGTIACEPRDGGGSIFTITLPVAKEVYAPGDFISDNAPRHEDSLTDRRQGFTEAVREAQVEPMNDHRVLIVEDDAEIRAFLSHELGRYFQVDVACDGQEALEKIENGKLKMEDGPADENNQSSIFNYQLIITDVMMPRMDGYELLRHIRQQTATSHLPVVLLTALDADQQQLRGLDAGADAYITKPFSMQLLLLQCRNLLQRADRMRHVYAVQPDDAPAKAAAPKVVTDERDHKLLAQLDMWVSSHLASPELSVDKFAEEMGYGRTSFYAKLKALTGQTPNEYIKEHRLQRAAELLRDDRVTVAEVAYQVGMGTPQYLSTVFKKRFGITPSQYQKGERTDQSE